MEGWARRIRNARGRVVLASVAVLGLLVAGAVVAAVDDGPLTSADHEGVATTILPPGAFDKAASPETALGGRAATGNIGAGDSALVAPSFAPSPVPPLVDPAGPRIVRSADISVEVRKGGFSAAFDRAASIASANGGFVSSSSSTAVDGRETGEARRPTSGELTIRVPVDRFDAARLALGELGTVQQSSLRGEDVGGQIVDYDARLRSLKAQEDAFRTLAIEAKSVSDVLQVQSRLFEVRQQIEQLQAERNHLDQAASLATIRYAVFEPGVLVSEPPQPATGLRRSVERAVDGSIAVVGGMLVVIGWLVPLAVVGLLGWGGARVLRRRGTHVTPGPTAAAP